MCYAALLRQNEKDKHLVNTVATENWTAKCRHKCKHPKHKNDAKYYHILFKKHRKFIKMNMRYLIISTDFLEN